jgi:hypothetical protein
VVSTYKIAAVLMDCVVLKVEKIVEIRIISQCVLGLRN